jgi:hypothetical protein
MNKTEENLIEPTESNVRYWTQRIIDVLEGGDRPVYSDFEKVIRELITADTHYAASLSTTPPASEATVPQHMPSVEELCIISHDAYEREALRVGWRTQDACKKPWDDLPNANKDAMRASISAVREACLNSAITKREKDAFALGRIEADEWKARAEAAEREREDADRNAKKIEAECNQWHAESILLVEKNSSLRAEVEGLKNDRDNWRQWHGEWKALAEAAEGKIENAVALYNETEKKRQDEVGHLRALLDKTERELLTEAQLHKAQRALSATHRCKVCGALWIMFKNSWSLASQECGKCCDNQPMGEQIEPFGVFASIIQERDTALAQLAKRQWVSVSERMPDGQEDLLTWDGEMVMITMPATGEPPHQGRARFDYLGVTHWMPLPIPPTQAPATVETCPTCGSAEKSVRESMSKPNCGPPLFPCQDAWHNKPTPDSLAENDEDECAKAAGKVMAEFEAENVLAEVKAHHAKGGIVQWQWKDTPMHGTWFDFSGTEWSPEKVYRIYPDDLTPAPLAAYKEALSRGEAIEGRFWDHDEPEGWSSWHPINKDFAWDRSDIRDFEFRIAPTPAPASPPRVEMPKIKTRFIHPPIPIRSFDWEATRDGYDKGDPVGFGRTEELAIKDLEAQEEA